MTPKKAWTRARPEIDALSPRGLPADAVPTVRSGEGGGEFRSRGPPPFSLVWSPGGFSRIAAPRRLSRWKRRVAIEVAIASLLATHAVGQHEGRALGEGQQRLERRAPPRAVPVLLFSFSTFSMPHVSYRHAPAAP